MYTMKCDHIHAPLSSYNTPSITLNILSTNFMSFYLFFDNSPNPIRNSHMCLGVGHPLNYGKATSKKNTSKNQGLEKWLSG